jgi:hypothetical protein
MKNTTKIFIANQFVKILISCFYFYAPDGIILIIKKILLDFSSAGATSLLKEPTAK